MCFSDFRDYSGSAELTFALDDFKFFSSVDSMNVTVSSHLLKSPVNGPCL